MWNTRLFLQTRHYAWRVGNERADCQLREQDVIIDHTGYRTPEEIRYSHVVGVHCEIAAAANARVRYHPTIGRRDADDVGPFQVRGIAWRTEDRVHLDKIHLLIREADDNDKPYLLAVAWSVQAPLDTVDFVGWLQGGAGKQPDWKRNGLRPERPPAYFVPIFDEKGGKFPLRRMDDPALHRLLAEWKRQHPGEVTG
jgi:hypothetical protein